MELQLQGSGSVQVSDDTFAVDFKESLVHQVVTACCPVPAAETPSKRRVRRSGAVV